tara:strand:- start:98 stop:256 length:159 start_codon:yes stop_codon:yes gene_type:complete
MKDKKAIKYIISHPEYFSEAEQAYARLIKRQRKLRKKVRKNESKSNHGDPKG